MLQGTTAQKDFGTGICSRLVVYAIIPLETIHNLVLNALCRIPPLIIYLNILKIIQNLNTI